MRVHASATTWLQRGVLAVLGTTLVVAGLQATGSAVATVQVADGTAWLTNAPRGTLVQVSSASEEATATVEVADAGDNLVARQDGHSALVLNRSTGEIGRVDGAPAPLHAPGVRARLVGRPPARVGRRARLRARRQPGPRARLRQRRPHRW